MIPTHLSIEVRRDFLLVDAMKEARKKKFDARKNLKVWEYHVKVVVMILPLHDSLAYLPILCSLHKS